MSKSAPINFDSLDTAAAAETPYEFELVHPASKAPLGVFVSVIGTDGSSFKAGINRSVNRDRRKAFEAQRKGVPVEPNMLEEDEAETVKMICGLMRGWRTVLDGKSEPVIHWGSDQLEFSAENAARWLTHFDWVRPQIIEAAKDVRNFLKN